MHKMIHWLTAGVLSIAGAAALAAGDHGQHASSGGKTTAGSAMVMTAGEVRKVDSTQSKVTLKHEAISNLDMPAMTMVFRVQKPEMLKDLKVGDKVRFHAESVDGAITVTHLQSEK